MTEIEALSIDLEKISFQLFTNLDFHTQNGTITKLEKIRTNILDRIRTSENEKIQHEEKKLIHEKEIALIGLREKELEIELARINENSSQSLANSMDTMARDLGGVQNKDG